jgi:hypothetical protein
VGAAAIAPPDPARGGSGGSRQHTACSRLSGACAQPCLAVRLRQDRVKATALRFSLHDALESNARHPRTSARRYLALYRRLLVSSGSSCLRPTAQHGQLTLSDVHHNLPAPRSGNHGAGEDPRVHALWVPGRRQGRRLQTLDNACANSSRPADRCPRPWAAGKTTLLRYLLENSKERIACIVNDVAAINIDAKLVRNDRNRTRAEQVNTTADLADTIELANGCACRWSAPAWRPGDLPWAAAASAGSFPPPHARASRDASAAGRRTAGCNLQDELFASFEQILALAEKNGQPYTRCGWQACCSCCSSQAHPGSGTQGWAAPACWGCGRRPCSGACRWPRTACAITHHTPCVQDCAGELGRGRAPEHP